MSEVDPSLREQAEQVRDDLLVIGEFAVHFANTRRLVTVPNLRIHENDSEVFARKFRYENDSEHSYHLGLSAVEIAARHYPDLDTGLVAQFALVHDMGEEKRGDTPSFGLTAEQREAKEKADKEAVEEVIKELPPYLGSLLRRYEEQTEPEARFVRMVDKLMPAVIHAVATEGNSETFLPKYGITTPDQLLEKSLKNAQRLRELFPEFEFLHVVKELVSTVSRNAHFPNQ